MSAGYVGILSAELHFPESGSLKTKRKDLKSTKAQLIQRFQVAVAEVDHHDTWQRSRLTISCVGRTHADAASVLESVERFICSRDYEVTVVQREVARADEWPD
jgi:uncharacterized protein YlxP (DUF503 family)